ncbi:hypothetical protein PVAND_009572 [Polypedilum vanderplanki]|uniref:Uncharacterized protein n=1 Tax=Polypedilum vanderplanki TaxID=319348 RepID=A0A9J6CCZ2_POLVA|nr:hypothetical protein PVAND_009572 [Polypedilum vanderplanki]
MDTKDIDINDQIESKRPRRSCVLAEKLTTKSENSDGDFSEASEPDNNKDEDFTLNKPKKKKPKSAKKLKRKKERNSEKTAKEAPSWSQVEKAHRSLEQKYAEQYYDSTSEEECAEEEEEEEEIIEQPILKPELVTEPVKKKKIVIRPWNPGWYTMPH